MIQNIFQFVRRYIQTGRQYDTGLPYAPYDRNIQVGQLHDSKTVIAVIPVAYILQNRFIFRILCLVHPSFEDIIPGTAVAADREKKRYHNTHYPDNFKYGPDRDAYAHNVYPGMPKKNDDFGQKLGHQDIACKRKLKR